ncbi:signal peptidase I [Microbacterium hominis]|uniref:Signal peptidase I n=1 Tax=Microbacterium hominis TaxID=162426 RepID=A0A7D4QH47_9MICO|nr:signal peptidase I [Microbacterium hominis]QKJ18676.1 signal peptidase I [Microbacterium hominis]
MTWRGLAAAAAPVVGAVCVIAAIGVAHVEHDSMSPTLSAGTRVVYDRVSTPHRGDIVLIEDRGGWSGVAGATLIKRVIGVAGDQVVCCEPGTGRLIVNGIAVDEPFVDGERPGGSIPFRITVARGTVFVMGDNRGASLDSRAGLDDPGHGGVAVDDVLGVVRAWW